MAKLTLTDVANLYGNPTTAANTINANNAAIEAALENTLSRDGSIPNQLNADLDLNHNDVTNVETLSADKILLNGVEIVTGDVYNQDSLKIANNLSDVASTSQSRTNLGLGDIATHNTSEFATAVQGAKADSALQPADIGTSVQAYSAGLTSIAALVTSADKVPYTTASNVYAVTTLTAFGRSLIDDVDAATSRTTLGLGTAATQNTGTSGANVPLLNGANTWSSLQNLAGASFGSTVAASITDLSKHIALYGTDYGFNVTSGQMNIDVPTNGAFAFNIAGAQVGKLNASSFALGNNIPITFSGTGAATTRTNLGAAASGANSDITSLSGLTTALSVTQGGTGGNTQAAARTGIGLGTIATQAASSVAITGGSITGITDLAIADGGTGASDAATARTNLGLTSAATMNAVVSGTFTPALTFGGGSTGLTYSSRTGTYTRIGSLVFFTLNIQLSAKGTSTGAAVISGLPFTAVGAAAIQISGYSNLTTSGTAPYGLLNDGTTSISLALYNTGTQGGIQDSMMTNATTIVMSGVYNMGSLT